MKTAVKVKARKWRPKKTNLKICRCGHVAGLHGGFVARCAMPGCRCRWYIARKIKI